MDGERIRPEPAQSLLDLLGCEPFTAATEGGEDFVRRERGGSDEIQLIWRRTDGRDHAISLEVGTHLH